MLSVAHIFRGLKYRNFRIFFIGQSMSLMGTWMQNIAMSWLVYRMTNSPFMLGLIAFSSQVPSFFLGPLAGVIVDRHDKKKLIILTQLLSMAQAFILAVLTLTGLINVQTIFILGIFLGCVNALDIPARQAFIVEMVEDKKDLGNAIALNSLVFNSARLIGPSIAGVLIAIVGEGVCFLINSFSFLAILKSLFSIKVKSNPRPAAQTNVMHDFKEGLKYVNNLVAIKTVVIHSAIISILGISYVVLLPVFAKETLKGGSHTLGILMGSAGLGALMATSYLASRRNVVGLEKMIPKATLIMAAGLMFFSFSKSLFVSMVLLGFVGFGAVIVMSACNIILQTIVDDSKRGRVISIYAMAVVGTVPFGSLIAGGLADKVGAPLTCFIGGALSVAAAGLFIKKMKKVRDMLEHTTKIKGPGPEGSALGSLDLAINPED